MKSENLKLRLVLFNYNKLLVAFVFFVGGALALMSARFILIDKKDVHYHANFALYINGQKEEFKNFIYYEEVTACSEESKSNPKSRVHMHDNVNHLVHIHDDAVTWSHFFNNLGIVISNNSIITPNDTYMSSETSDLIYVLNGKKISSITNLKINSGDKLLINFGNEKENEIEARYNAIPKDAETYNAKPDPSSCSGNANETFGERFKRTILN